MKATIKTTVMLMAMTIGTLAASAQSAERGTPHRNTDKKASSAVSSSKNQRSHNNKAIHSNRQVNRSVTAQKTKRQQPAAIQGRHVNRSTTSSRQKISTTTRHNPGSNYRSPNTLSQRPAHSGKTYRDPKPVNNNNAYKSNNYNHKANRNKYNTNHRHVYYPKSRVSIHVHPATSHHHYRVLYYPAHREIIWTHRMRNHYIGLYPGYSWRYPVGYRIQTMSAFEARYNMGEIARVYGRVYATWYNRETDNLLLFFGGEFPQQEFTMVVPGHIARRYSWRPERYFLGQHIMATGLIGAFEGNPEMIIKKKSQLDVY